MNAESMRRIRDQLETRRKRLLESNNVDFYPKLKRLWVFLNGNPLVKGALAPLEQRKPSGVQPPKGTCLAESDLDHAANAYNALAKAVRSDKDYTAVKTDLAGSRTSSSRDNMNTHLVQPLFDYLTETLDEQQVTLGYLLRYAQRCEWFDRERLYALAAQHRQETKAQGKRSEVEKLLKTGLYRYLHDQGVDFVIEPYSERGEIDLIADQKGEQATYIEVKVFDNEGKGRAYLQDGFNQLFTYLVQYKAPAGYLAIYKLCKENLSFNADGIVQTVPFITHDGKTIHLLVIDLYPYDKPVSQRGNLVTVRVTKEQLVRATGV